MRLTLQNTAIVLDSTADLPDVGHRPNWRVVPLYVRFGDDVYRDYVDMQPPEFYARLRATKEQPRSSQPSPGDFQRAVNELGAYERVLILAISSRLSGTHESARTAAEADPSQRVRAIDSGFSSGTIVLLAEAIQRRLARETDDAEIAELVERFRHEARFVLTLETLDYLVRSGRAGRAKALAGTLASLKPILAISDGVVVPAGRVRGRARSLEELLRIFLHETEDDPSVRVGLVHSDAEQELDALDARIRDERPNVSHDFRGMFGPVLGTSAGPGAIAITWFRDTA